MKTINLKDGDTLIISKASIEDAEGIIRFLNKVGGETNFLTFGLNEFNFTVDEEKKMIAKCLESDRLLMLIGKINDEIVSHLFINSSNKPRLSHLGEIHISVIKKHWGKSIGKNMISCALDWAKAKGISKIQLQVRTDNTRGINLYENFGFKIEGKITRVTKIDEIYYDDYIMGLNI